MKKRLWKKAILAIVVIISGVLLASKINHEVRLEEERKELQSYGVGEPIDFDGDKINIYAEGNDRADNTIVYMHGLGMGDTTVAARPMLEAFENEYKICILDRYGNGMSDDTNKKQTVENIIEEYRNVLKNANQKAPYILLAHSISGIYATYWAQTYPNEIKSIIYIDADPVECFAEEGKVNTSDLIVSKGEQLLSSMGLQRILASESTLIGEAKNQIYTNEENRIRKLLMYQHTFSKATCSELELYYANAQTVLKRDMNFHIPQLYISAIDTEGDYYKSIYSNILEKRFHGDKEKIQNNIDTHNNIINEKIKHMKKRNNVEIVKISGPHCLYEYNPDEVTDAILKFLNISNKK